MKIDPGMINDLFPFLLFSVIFIVALVGSYFSLKKQKEKMRDIALKLGLEFSQTDPLSFMGQGKPVRPAYHRPSDAGIDLQGWSKRWCRDSPPGGWPENTTAIRSSSGPRRRTRRALRWCSCCSADHWEWV